MLALIFAAGVLHGLGPDHLAAITAVAGAGAGFQRITSFAVRFALGHGVTILLAGAAAFFGRRFLPAIWERNFDLLAGVLLVGVGAALLAGLLTKRIVLHRHSHAHSSSDHMHLHLHLGSGRKHGHLHGVATVLVGALFALGSSRKVIASGPLLLARDGFEFFLRIAAFTFGIVISMTLFGLVARKLLANRMSALTDPYAGLRRLTYATASFCVVAGVWTIVSRLQS